ncbi:uncharacterized protein LOC127246273 [Andrographis paniculata]|uniref:uncharacterized protein LOC127246273 n=1 Tax=Andrographis paniculata TaxID=175694 RepID=UPI0021E7DF44|nr:uncharacterized protein LOC127246273 [Andrographis paniculata]
MESANSGSTTVRDHDTHNHDFPDSISPTHHQQQQQLQFLLSPHHHQNPNFFDNNNLHTSIPNTNHNSSNTNHHLLWNNNNNNSRSVGRSDANFPYFGTLMSPPPPPPPTAPDPTATLQATFPAPSSSIDHSQRPSPNAAVKNPKKRTRASRRAPTTVLTTDVTNFRQMVQEFTGIPASPFSAASPYSRSFDLFSNPSAAALRTGGGFPYSFRPLQYPPRPNPSKLPSPFSSSNSISGNSNNPNEEMNYTSNYHLLNHLQQQRNNSINIPLQLGAAMNLGNLSGFLSRESTTFDGDGRRWKSGSELTVARNINAGGIEEPPAAAGNHNVVGFDDGRGTGRGAPLSGGAAAAYNLNTAEKGMDNDNAAAAGGSAAAAGEGTVGSWMCTSH